MARPKSLREWVTVLTIGVVVAAALAFPAYVVRTINNETEILLEELDERAVEATERAIRVNALTIVCVAAIPAEDHSVDALIECINDRLPRDEEIG